MENQQNQPAGNNTAVDTTTHAEALRAQMAEITTLCVAHGQAERAADFIGRGLSPDQVAREILASRTNTGGAAPVRQPAVEPTLNAREAKDYSYTRALQRAVAQAEGGKVDNCLELEISQDLRKAMPIQYKERGGVFIPLRLRQAGAVQTRAALDSKTTGAAKELVFTEYGGEMIELLRNASVVSRMGARILTGLNGPIAFTRQTGAVAATWVAENPGSDVGETEGTVDLVTLSPKTLQGTTAFSRQLLLMSVNDVEAMVREDLAIAHALAWDLAAIHGTGTGNQPTGIYNLSGVNVEDFAGGNPDLAKVLAMIGALATDNALLGGLGFAGTPEVATKARGTLEFSAAGSSTLWQGRIDEGEMLGYRAMSSNQFKKNMGTGTNEHGLVFGNWRDLYVGQFGGAVELIVDPYAKKKQGLIEVTSFQMADVAARHPQSFTKATGLIPA